MFLSVCNAALLANWYPPLRFLWIARYSNHKLMFNLLLRCAVEHRQVLNQHLTLSHLHRWIAIAKRHIDLNLPHLDIQINRWDTKFAACLLKISRLNIITVSQTEAPTDFF